MFSNPIASGSGGLILPSIHSPGYVHGNTGWSINRDGSAEFNDLDVRGMLTIENADEGVFVYSGTPALGNLIASISSTNGTDTYGNKYPEGIATENHSGFTSRGDNSESNYLIMTVPNGNNPIALFNHDNTAFTDGFIQALQDGTSPYTGKLTLLTTAPTGKDANSIEMLSEQSDSSAPPVTLMHSDVTVDGDFTAGGIGKTFYAVKASDQNNNSATFAADSALQFAAVTNAVYQVDWWMAAASPTASRFSARWAIPTGATGTRHGMGPTSVVADGGNRGDSKMRLQMSTTLTTAFDYCVDATNTTVIHESGIVITGATPGNIGIEFAQSVAGAGTTKMFAGSYFHARRIG